MKPWGDDSNSLHSECSTGSLKGCLHYQMKTSSLFNLFLCILMLTANSRSKSSLYPDSSQHNGSVNDVPYYNSYPIADDWVLQYADGGSGNNHTAYPQDGTH